MNQTRHVILGLFFFGALTALGSVTIYLGDWNPLAPRTTLTVHFEEVAGLRAGDAVQVYGVRLGRVREVAITDSEDPEHRLRVTLSMKRPVGLTVNSKIEITDTSVLGGKQVEIDIGDGAFLTEDAELLGTVKGGPLDAFGEVVSENRSDFQRLVGGLGEIAESLASGRRSLAALLLEEQAYGDFNGILGSLRSVIEKVDRGDGSLARLINDPILHDQISTLSGDLGIALKELNEGDGSLARLLREPELYDSLQASAASLQNLLVRLETGEEGMVARLLSKRSDPMYEDLEQASANLRQLSDDLTTARGLLGKLISDDVLSAKAESIIDDLGQVAADLTEMTDGVKRGQGVLGYLVNDPEAARELRHIVASISGALEDAREAAPVSSLASFLFGSF